MVLMGMVVGACSAIVVRLAIDPWDLSYHPGRRRSGDDFALESAAVGVLIALAAVAPSVFSRAHRSASAFAAGGLWCWTALFAWRPTTSTATTSSRPSSGAPDAKDASRNSSASGRGDAPDCAVRPAPASGCAHGVFARNLVKLIALQR